jgi:hypothetical protein
MTLMKVNQLWMKRLFKYVIVIIVGVILGILAERNKGDLIDAQYIRDHWHFTDPVDNKNEIISSDDVMVFLAIGQSNAANYGDGTYVCRNNVYNYYKGDLYPATEPLLGADGKGSSVWTRVADMLIDSGMYKKVIIIPCAIGSTSVECWDEGFCKEKLAKTLDYLKKDNIKLTHVFWQQGETDNVNGTTKPEYKRRLKNIIKFIRDNQQSNVPFYSSITSYFPYDNTKPFGIDTAISRAQEEVIKEMTNVRYGPFTDSLNLAYYRVDGVHFTEKGLDKLAAEWYKKINVASK